MKVNARFTIAVHALLMIAYFPDVRVTSEMVAASVGTNPVTIRNIYRSMKQAGLLSVQRGVGVTGLARPADTITLWDVYQAVETDAVEEMFKFSDSLSGECPIGGSIRELLLVHVREAVDALKERLSETTIEELRCEIEAHNARQVDFAAIVDWYRSNGYASTTEIAG